jgi:hypothetical protein
LRFFQSENDDNISCRNELLKVFLVEAKILLPTTVDFLECPEKRLSITTHFYGLFMFNFFIRV